MQPMPGAGDQSGQFGHETQGKNNECKLLAMQAVVSFRERGLSSLILAIRKLPLPVPDVNGRLRLDEVAIDCETEVGRKGGILLKFPQYAKISVGDPQSCGVARA